MTGAGKAVPRLARPGRQWLAGAAFVLAVSASGCARWRFVGSNYVPMLAYEGDERPDAEVATISWGRSVVVGGVEMFSPLLSVDGVMCSTPERAITTGSTDCTKVLDVEPGEHSVSGYLRTPDVPQGWVRTWVHSGPLVLPNLMLSAGYVYAIEPDPRSKEPALRLVEVCKSSDHLKTAMGFANLKHPREAPGCE